LPGACSINASGGRCDRSEVEEGIVNGEQTLVTYPQAVQLSEPDIGSFYNPSALVEAELASIFIVPTLIVLPLQCDLFNASPLEPFAEWVGVVAAVGYDMLRLLPRPTSGLRDSDFRDCRL
jgi:hypothetical protein